MTRKEKTFLLTMCIIVLASLPLSFLAWIWFVRWAVR